MSAQRYRAPLPIITTRKSPRRVIERERNIALALAWLGVVGVLGSLALDMPQGYTHTAAAFTLGACLAGLRRQLMLPR